MRKSKLSIVVISFFVLLLIAGIAVASFSAGCLYAEANHAEEEKSPLGPRLYSTYETYNDYYEKNFGMTPEDAIVVLRNNQNGVRPEETELYFGTVEDATKVIIDFYYKMDNLMNYAKGQTE